MGFTVSNRGPVLEGGPPVVGPRHLEDSGGALHPSARDVGGLVGGEEGDRCRDLVDGGEAAERRGGLDRVLDSVGQRVRSSVTTKPGATALNVILRAILEAPPNALAVE
jgi:hypothetical protein